MINYLEDEDFQESVVAHLVRDRQFLRKHGHLLISEDFKPVAGSTTGRDRWVIATKAIEHWIKFQEPIAHVLKGQLKEHAHLAKIGEKRTKVLLRYGSAILQKELISPNSISQKLLEWKKQVVLSKAISEFIDSQANNTLSTDKFMSIAREAVQLEAKFIPEELDFFDNLEKRIERRANAGDVRFYPLMIDPFDAETVAIARGHVGLILAPYKRGKSMMLNHIATSYSLQRLNVLLITLEDPKEDVEDRLDASIAGLPIRSLNDMPKTLRSRTKKFLRMARGRIKVIDGTDQDYGVQQIENIWLRERENGFTADAVIVDYDDEIVPAIKGKERRFEFAQIYRDLRKFAARNQLLLWTAAQTKRGTGDSSEISGDDVAEDISKIRKVACAISLGKSKWKDEPDAIHLYVTAHKYNRQHVGVDIMTDRERSMIYDPRKTAIAQRKHANEDQIEE